MWIVYNHFYWLFACLGKKNYLQLYLDSCAHKIVNTEMVDYLDDNLSGSAKLVL